MVMWFFGSAQTRRYLDFDINLVFLVGIGWYLPSIYHTNTNLAGNGGNMSTTCRQRVEMSTILGRHACWCRHKNYPNARMLCRGSPTIVDAGIRTYAVVHTPRGGNTVDKLNKSKLSGHVNFLTLVLPLVCWWCCCCCLSLWQWTTVSFTMVVAVPAVAAWQQQQRWWGQWWTTIGGKSGQQPERWWSHDGVE